MSVTVTPTVRAVGAIDANVGAISPGLPAGTIAGDLLVMFLETANEAITVAGWTQLASSSPQGTGTAAATGASRLTVFWKIAVGGDATTTSDSGDHQVGRIIGITANTFNAAAPIDSSAGGVRTPAGTTATVPGPTTTQAQCLVLAASSHDLDQSGGAFSTATWANAALTSIVERINNSSTQGNGGGLAVASGVKATAGAVGNTTVTVLSSVGGMIALAIAPGTAENNRVSQLPVEVLVKPTAGAVVSQEPVEAIVSGWVPPIGESYWVVGTLTVPGSAGAQAVTGLGRPGRTPKGVVFFGANWTAEDTVVTSSGTAVFRGMAAEQWDSPGTIAQHAAAVGPGDQHRAASSAILNVSSAGTATVLYEATVTSLDVNGFTLNWATVAAGYKVVYAALFEVEECAAYVGTVNATLSGVGFKAGASLLQGCWGSIAQSGDDRSQEWYGGGAYPTGASGNWFAAGLATQCFPTSQSDQYQLYLDAQEPTILTVSAQHFTGPFLTGSNLKAYPAGTNLEDFRFIGDGSNAGMVMFWDDSDSKTGFATPDSSAAGVVAVSTPFDPGLVIGYSASDEPRAQGTGGRGAAGFAVIGADADGNPYQWGALVDRINPGAYQSFAKIPNVVHDSSIQTFTGELVPGGFELTTVDVDVAPKSWLWHAFGHPAPPPSAGVGLPQIYRRVFSAPA